VFTLEDCVILDMFFERKESAIEETKCKYGKRLFRTSHNILNNKEDAEECVSDTLMKAWGTIPPNRPVMLGAFLVKIARNLSINKWEAKSAAKRGGGEAHLLLSELEECVPSSTGTEEAYESIQTTEAINSFLSAEKRTARVAFVLRYFHGESIHSICTRFQMSESKIKSMLFRTRQKLKIHLEKEGVVI